ncbi:hypothetical protein GCM10015535_02690 [Streptomyces gelaticus]|uniref:Uncharacterized protein n=1 Tax=Streptomyces gelaticus TaxID=285446 RepID=A0ABQ2VS77_9ACTN|nr:hypothetical protein GCM10015535_02690 [Streptomyces gelaticus]
MSGLWSDQPVSLKLEDLNVICVVLGYEIADRREQPHHWIPGRAVQAFAAPEEGCVGRADGNPEAPDRPARA